MRSPRLCPISVPCLRWAPGSRIEARAGPKELAASPVVPPKKRQRPTGAVAACVPYDSVFTFVLHVVGRLVELDDNHN